MFSSDMLFSSALPEAGWGLHHVLRYRLQGSLFASLRCGCFCV